MTEKSKEEIKVSPHFFLRRLHSLTGVFPIGGFLLEHMFSNSFIIRGPEAYNKQIEFLMSLPYVPFIEISFIYVSYHVYHTKIVNILYGTEVSYARMAQLMHDPKIFWFYIIGLAAVMFHFANGVWGFLISWGITVGTKARRASGYICTLLGLSLYAAGANALIHLIK